MAKSHHTRDDLDDRLELEAKILVAALKQSIDRGDTEGADLASHFLSNLLRKRAIEAYQRIQDYEEAEPLAEIKVDANADEPIINMSLEPEQSTFQEPEEEEEEEEGPIPLALAHGGAEKTLLANLEEAASPPQHEPASPNGKVNFYELLSTNMLSSYREIHVRFLRMVKKLIGKQKSLKEAGNGASTERAFRIELRNLWVAHDVLKDPVNRADYDLGLLCNREGSQLVPDNADKNTIEQSAKFKIGELLQAAEILDACELAIAVDMHRAVPEMMFGQFMVNQGYLTQEELDDALYAQKLIWAGKLTVAQFRQAMIESRASERTFRDELIKNGWVTTPMPEGVEV